MRAELRYVRWLQCLIRKWSPAHDCRAATSGTARSSYLARVGPVFRSVTQVCLGISISISYAWCFVAMGRNLFIFSDVTSKMDGWQSYWIFRFPDASFILALDIKSRLHWHITCVYGKKPFDFSHVTFKMAAWQPYWIFWYLDSGFLSVSRVCFGI